VTASGDPVLGVKFPGPTRHSRPSQPVLPIGTLLLRPESGPKSGPETSGMWITLRCAMGL
jgi:hypothetical protein